ncbi:1-phosphofructokinase [Natrinema salaciae]|uniref:1-phosphofructokinase n=1 Tax=Natrinema salaciae TaxID=1186196 RepID=A0A1H9NKZ1_9EURY|nr:1-phosphofructokinase [Natrinema salaciae]SER36063.1 fructose-1-phosphate kinase [Natrinema salaciae]
MILTVTLNPAVDHTLTVDELPAPDTVARTDTAHVDPGGKGINVSQYLVELDTETVATGVVGDFLGRFVRDSLSDDGIPSDFVEIEGRTRLNTTILTDEAEYKINHNGPTVDSSAIDGLLRSIDRHDPDTVVVGGSLPPGLEPDAIDRIARESDCPTAVDVGGDILRELDASYALCKPNREELAAATGRRVESRADCYDAIEHLRQRGYDRVIASLGADGAIMATPDERLHATALDADVVDTVGAGDSMLAGVLSALDRGATDEEALRTGVAVASCVVSVPGTDVPPFGDMTNAIDRVSLSRRDSSSHTTGD